MAEVIKDKYLILKNEDIQNYLSELDQNRLNRMIEVIQALRNGDGKNPENTYYICNADEPYGDKVLKAILSGEDEKAGITLKPLTIEELMQMRGHPVYIVELCDVPYNRWEILDRECPVDMEAQDVNLEGGDCYATYMLGKNWAAYDRPPTK